MIKLNRSQSGYASFVITLVTIIVVGLIVIAFAADSRLEQRSALNSSLYTQAYYSAESGVNDAVAVANAYIANNQTPPATGTNCNSSSYIVPGTSNILNPAGSATTKYTCLLVDPTPPSLSYQEVDPGNSQVIEIQNKNIPTIKSINISWLDKGATPNFSACPTTTPAIIPALGSSLSVAGACTAGILQVDLISNTAFNSELSTNPFTSNAKTIYLEPNLGGASTVSLTPGTVVYPAAIKCTGSNCSATLDLTALPQDTTYFMRLESFYKPETVNIKASDINGGPVAFQGAQILIDSTGYANGQYKRIQERVCYGNYCDSGTPAGAIQSTQCILKNFSVYPGEAPGSVSIPLPAGCTHS